MTHSDLLIDPKLFAVSLFEKMKLIEPGIAEMELYEFIYTLNNITPNAGWAFVTVSPKDAIEKMVNDREFYDRIKIKEKVNGKIVLDPHITDLNSTTFRRYPQ